MKSVWLKLLAIVALIGLIAGFIYFFWIPQQTPDYPPDLTVQEYGENIRKTNDLMIQKIEESQKPTLKEALAELQHDKSWAYQYPTMGVTLDKIEAIYGKKYGLKRGETTFLQRLRYRLFMKKYYPNLQAFSKELRQALDEAGKKGERQTVFNHPPYTYKDGSVITFSGELFSTSQHE